MNERMTAIQQLAADMECTEADVSDFVAQLKVYTDKGLSLEDAIQKGKEAWISIIKTASDAATEVQSQFVTSVFFPA